MIDMKIKELKTIVVSILLLLPLMAVAQELTVKRMEVAGSDLSASVYPRNDLNGNPCGLVKVQLPTEIQEFPKIR